MLGFGDGSLDDQPNDLEHRADDAAANECASTDGQRYQRIVRSDDGCRNVSGRRPAEQAGNVTTCDANSCADGIEPNDQPRSRPNRFAERLSLGPRNDHLHADGHSEACEREQSTKRCPFLEVLVNSEATKDEADNAQANEHGAALEELHCGAGERRVPEPEESLGDEAEQASEQETVDYCLVRFHYHPLHVETCAAQLLWFAPNES